MPYIIAVVAVLICIFIIRYRADTRRIRAIFTDEHYKQICLWVIEMLDLGAVQIPSADNRTRITTDAGINLLFTRCIKERDDSLHISISQAPDIMTHAVGGRIIFLIISLLNSNRIRANCFYTKRTVHHLILDKQSSGDWIVNPMDAVVARMKDYTPPPLRLEELPK